MNNPLRTAFCLVFWAIAASTVARAGPGEDAMLARDRGDFPAAFRQFNHRKSLCVVQHCSSLWMRHIRDSAAIV
jgi:hypothetical protein